MKSSQSHSFFHFPKMEAKLPPPIPELCVYPNKSIVGDLLGIYYRDTQTVTELGKSRSSITYFVDQIILYYEKEQFYFLVYFDKNLNFVKEIKYLNHAYDLFSNIILLDDNKILKKYGGALTFSDSTEPIKCPFPLYAIDDEKNIITVTKLQTHYRITTYFASDNYNTFTECYYEYSLPIHHNRLYHYILPDKVIKYYIEQKYYIIHAFQNDNIYYVISRNLSPSPDVIVDRITIAETIENIMRLNHPADYYQLNLLMKRTAICITTGSSRLVSIVSEDYSLWRKRILDLFINFTCLTSFSTDLLNLFIDYIASPMF